jgi:Fe-S cluster assembly protein SufD
MARLPSGGSGGVEVAPHTHGGRPGQADGQTGTPLSTLHEHASYDVADFPVPTGREEAWRFTPMRRLRGLHKGEPGQVPAGKVEIVATGREPVRTEWVERGDARVGAAYVPVDRVSAQAYGSFDRALVLTVPRECVLTEPLTIEVKGLDGGLDVDSGAAGRATGAGTAGSHPPAAYGHIVVQVEPLAQAIVVLDYGGSATYADNVEFVVGEGASLSVVSLQNWADDAVHLSHHHARLHKDARFTGFAVTLGGQVVRLAPSVSYAAPGGDAELFGLYFADNGQHLEHRLLVDHSMPNCRSRVDYRGALQGDQAHTVWIGDVIIRPEAEATDTFELNRNLVLTDGARADSVPNLEILTGEVEGAGHASTSGRLDDEHLFYLQARGIPYDEARRLVIRGFFGQLIERIQVPSLREQVVAAIDAELERSVS